MAAPLRLLGALAVGVLAATPLVAQLLHPNCLHGVDRRGLAGR
jgi:hypothetical protein